MLNRNSLRILFVVFVFALPACVKQKDVPVSDCGTVVYDGYEYHTVQIGKQCWLRENLRNSHFRDGTPITEAEDSLNWVSDSIGVWCNFGGDSVTPQKRQERDAFFGKLYSWPASKDSRLCPNGWHVATMDEWRELSSNYLEPGNALRKVDTLWANGGPYATPTDISKFSALPGGARFENGTTFFLIDSDAYFWTYNLTQVVPFHLHYNTKFADTSSNGVAPARDGFSCRCVKDH